MKLALCPNCQALHVGDLSIDLGASTLRRKGRALRVTPYQARIFEVLARAHPAVVPAERLHFAIYGDREDGGPLTADNVLHVQINRLRKSLRESALGAHIQTFRGNGYRLVFLDAQEVAA